MDVSNRSSPERPKWFRLALGIFLAACLFAALFYVVLQIAKVVAVIAALILLGSLFHYFVWGRWIGPRSGEAGDSE